MTETARIVRHFDDIDFSAEAWFEVEYADAAVYFRVCEITGREASINGDGPHERCWQSGGAGSSMDFTVDLTTADTYLSGSVKWDGCSNWSFDEQDRGMLHFCAKQDAIALGTLMGYLYDWAKELGMDKL
jgi:hypothetical protein